MWQHGSLVEIEFPASGKIWEGQYTDRDVLTARWGPPGVRGVWSLSGRSLTWGPVEIGPWSEAHGSADGVGGRGIVEMMNPACAHS